MQITYCDICKGEIIIKEGNYYIIPPDFLSVEVDGTCIEHICYSCRQKIREFVDSIRCYEKIKVEI